MDNSIKRCNFCNQEKPLEDSFYRHKSGRDGYMSRCKSCLRAYSKSRKDKITAARRKLDKKRRQENPLCFIEYNLKAMYGISLQEKEDMLRAQDNRCANRACRLPLIAYGTKPGQANVACVDHNHTTDQLRGLLCHDCNKALGYVKDSPARLTGLIAYLSPLEDKELNAQI